MNQRVDQLERTRVAIIEAAAEFVVSEQDPAAFTMQAVADRAGVSHRTLYRHFQDRQDLVDATGKFLDAQFGGEEPTQFDEWLSAIARIVAFGATHRELMRRATALGVVAGAWRTDRDEHYWQMFRERFPHLDESVARQDFAMFRHVLGAANVVMIGERFALSVDEVAAAMERAVRALVASIDERDAAAAVGGHT